MLSRGYSANAGEKAGERQAPLIHGAVPVGHPEARAGLPTTDEPRLHSQSLLVARDSLLPLKLQVLFAWGFI